MTSHSNQLLFVLTRESSHNIILYPVKLVLITLAVILGCADFAVAQVSPWTVDAILTETASGQRFRTLSGLAEDPQTGELYVLDNGRRTIDIIDSAGLPRFSFVHWVADAQTGLRSPGEPNALVISPSGDIFITDFFSRTIDILNIRGECTGQIDVLHEIGWNEPTARPEKLALDGQGRLYVSIAGSRSGVARCEADGSSCQLLVDAGAEGVQALTGMSVAPDGRFAVLDYRGEPAVRLYDPDGRQVMAFGEHEIAEGDLSFPTAFLFAADGSYWIADALRHVVKHYTAEGKFLEYVGGYGGEPGNLRYPSMVTGDGVGRLVVSERVGARVQVYLLPGAEYATPVRDNAGTGSGTVAIDPESAQ